MPAQVFCCKDHGEFDVNIKFTEDIPNEIECRECGELSTHIIKAPAGIKVIRTWNEQANEYQRNPYTAAKAQATNSRNELIEQGVDSHTLPKITEENLQKAAKQIAKEKML